MAEQIDDNRFKGEVMRMLGNLINKANEHDKNFEEVSSRFDEVSVKVDSLASDLKLLSRQFPDVGSMAIKDNKRIDAIDERVGHLEAGVH